MTPATSTQALARGDDPASLTARLELLLQRVINLDQFEADVVQACSVDPDEIWTLLALLDQYHRLGKLPTELFRALKASADRRGLVHREPYISEPLAGPANFAEVARPPAAPPEGMPAFEPGGVPRFRHLLEAETGGDERGARFQPSQQGQAGQPVRVLQPPPQRSWLRPFLLMGLLAATVALAASFDRLPGLAAMTSRWNQVRGGVVDRLSSAARPPATVQAPALASAAPVAQPPLPGLKPSVPKPDSAISKVETTATRAAAPAAAAAPVPARIELSADHYAVLPGDSAARISVRRYGDLRGDVSFVWWTEGASAAADVDFISWGQRTERIRAGQNSVTLLVPIINDTTRSGSRTLYVLIGAAGDGARLGSNTRASVALPGSG